MVKGGACEFLLYRLPVICHNLVRRFEKYPPTPGRKPSAFIILLLLSFYRSASFKRADFSLPTPLSLRMATRSPSPRTRPVRIGGDRRSRPQAAPIQPGGFELGARTLRQQVPEGWRVFNELRRGYVGRGHLLRGRVCRLPRTLAYGTVREDGKPRPR